MWWDTKLSHFGIVGNLATPPPPSIIPSFLLKTEKVFFYFFFREDWDLVSNGFPKRKKKSNEIGSDDEIKQVCRQIGVPVKVSLIGMAEKRREKKITLVGPYVATFCCFVGWFSDSNQWSVETECYHQSVYRKRSVIISKRKRKRRRRKKAEIKMVSSSFSSFLSPQSHETRRKKKRRKIPAKVTTST